VATRNSESFYAAHGFVSVDELWFVRGAQALQYPVIRMQRHGSGSLPAPDAQAGA
jgi:hypothetical protein